MPAGWPLFAVTAVPPPGEFTLDGAEGRHAATVRRLRVGESLALTDGAGRWAPAAVSSVGKGELLLQVEAARVQPRPSPSVTVVQALPKGERSELAVELATEAGADCIVPWSAERCVARWTGDKIDKGVARWRQVSQEAAKQSRRAWFPLVDPLHSTAALVLRIEELTTSGGIALVLHEAESTPLQAVNLAGTDAMLLVVGPEGGVSGSELAALTAAGAASVRLGPEVLRTSTAAAVALGALGVLTARWQ